MKIHFVIFEEDQVMGTGIVDCGKAQPMPAIQDDWQEETSDLAMQVRRLKAMMQDLVADVGELKEQDNLKKHELFDKIYKQIEGKDDKKKPKK